MRPSTPVGIWRYRIPGPPRRRAPPISPMPTVMPSSITATTRTLKAIRASREASRGRRREQAMKQNMDNRVVIGIVVVVLVGVLFVGYRFFLSTPQKGEKPALN